jgi:aryl sulfotransferase
MMNRSANSLAAVGGQFAWLASYPKSGNTWLRIMLHSVCHGGASIDINDIKNIAILNRAEFDEHFGVKSSDLIQSELDAVRPDLHRAIAHASREPLILRKVHDRCWSNAAGQRIFPPEVSRGAIYIARDPRDVAVSYAHHFHLDMEESVRRMGDADSTLAKSVYRLETQFSQPLGSWSEHVASWLDHAAMPVLLVRYEDMLANAAQALIRVADFLGLSDETTPEACAKAASAAAFAALRSQEDERGFREKSPKAEKFFRRGSSGEGREVLSPALLRKIKSDHGAVMARLGYL